MYEQYKRFMPVAAQQHDTTNVIMLLVAGAGGVQSNYTIVFVYHFVVCTL